MSDSAQYCPSCCKIVPFLLLKSDKYEELLPETRIYYESFQELEASATQGCKLCRLMRQRFLLLAEDPDILKDCNHPLIINLNEPSSMIGRACFTLGCQGDCLWHRTQQIGTIKWYGIELILDNVDVDESSDGSEGSTDEEPSITSDMFRTDSSGRMFVKAGSLPSLEEINSRKNIKRYMRTIRPFLDKTDNREIKDPSVPGPYGNESTVITQAMKWLDDCDAFHDLCGTLRMANLCQAASYCDDVLQKCPLFVNEFYHPKRLLYIQGHNSQLSVSLVDLSTPGFTTNFAAHRGRYVCLSYRWGVRTHHMVTTKRNAHERKNGVPVASLPQTFADAIRICGSLGVNYIWIDAFCIEQPFEDEDGDWAEQSYQMDQIYGNAYFTLAASSSSNVYEGLIFGRPAALWPLEACRLSMRGYEVAGDRSYHQSGWISPVTVAWRHGVTIAPLQARGWVVQERMLSRRVLHWTRNTLFWECRESKASEYEPAGLHESHFNALGDCLDVSGCFDFGPKEVYPGQTWTDIAETFSEKEFTHPSDRLLAISGIVSQIHHSTTETYLAGHWQSNFLTSLLWTARKPVKFPKVAKVPTWSWVSVNTAIHFSNVRFSPKELNLAEVELIDTEVKHADVNPYGNLHRAALTLRGDLAVLRASATIWKGETILHSEGIFLSVDRAEDYERFLASEETVIICLKLYETTPYIVAKHQEPEEWRFLKAEHLQDQYLMLRPTGGVNEYVRIGTLTAYFHFSRELVIELGQGTIKLI